MPSPESLVVKQQLRQSIAARAGKKFTIEEMRQNLEAMMANVALAEDIKVEQVAIDGIPAEWVSAPLAAKENVFLYLHGGAYCLGSCNTHRDLAARISRATFMRVLVIEYRLAPEHPFPAGLEDAVAAYRHLVSSGILPENIVIGGDSAGGGLTLATLQTLRDAGEALPASAVLLSPWTDLEGTGASMETRREADPWLNPEASRATPAIYIGDWDRKHPLISPLYADFTGFPPMLVHVGNDEILLDDSVRLVENARNANVDVTFKIWDDMWHVFHSFAPHVPEAREAIEEIGDYVGHILGKNSVGT